MNNKIKMVSAFKYIILSVLSFISIFPFIWMVIAITNKSVDITKGTLIPGGYFFENLKNLLASDLKYATAFKNSLIISVATTTFAMIVSSAAGYAFEVYKTKTRDKIFNFILLSMMVPFATLIAPLFRMFSKFNTVGALKGISLNTHGAVIVISVATAFLIFFFRQNTKTFPKDLIEAARIDGLGEFSIFFRIFMPTMKSTYAAAIIVTFMSSWNNYMWPLISLQSPDKRTLPLVISALGSSYTPDYGMVMMAVVIATLPTALIFFLMQKHFVAGMTGSVKG